MAGVGDVYGYSDGHDGSSDPGGVWTDAAQVSDHQRQQGATCATPGSATANYLELRGATTIGDSGTILGVHACSFGAAVGPVVFGVEIADENRGEVLTAWQHSLGDTSALTDVRVSDWHRHPVSPPTGGWHWNMVRKLQTRTWHVSWATHATNSIELAVTTRGGSVGAVQAINRPTVDNAVRHNDLDTIRFDGPGIYERLFPVCAGSAEAGVKVRTSADYTGDPPVLEILNVPGACVKRWSAGRRSGTKSA